MRNEKTTNGNLTKRRMPTLAGPLLALAMVGLLLCAPSQAARIKDISTVRGVRGNQLFGFGLVVGLAGTGDGSSFTSEVAKNMLLKLRVGRGLSDVPAGNMAAVMVTTELPPFARKGTQIDVTVSTIDECKSLRGGTLLLTPLSGADGQVYAVAQGPLSVGGFTFGGAAANVQQGHPTVGRIPGGANIEREVPAGFVDHGLVTLCLRRPDFTTALRLAEVINDSTDAEAEVADAGTVRVQLAAAATQNQLMEQIGEIQMLEVHPDSRAIVVVNERTGTVVAGQNVSISSMAISHGNLTVITQEMPEVSQPAAFSETGETVQVPRTEMRIIETPLKEGGLTVLNRSTTVSEVARALNLLGASPRDIISIFQAIKEAGALHAELRIM